MVYTIEFVRHYTGHEITEFMIYDTETARSCSLFMDTTTAKQFGCKFYNDYSTTHIESQCKYATLVLGLLRCLWMDSNGTVTKGLWPDLTLFSSTARWSEQFTTPVVHWEQLDEDLAHTGFLSNCTTLVTYKEEKWICKSPEGLTDERVSQFREEIRVLYGLPAHPNVLGPPQYLVVRDTEVIGMLHPYYKRGNLREFVISLREKRANVNFFLFMWAVQLSKALIHLKDNGHEYTNFEAKNLVAKDNGDLLLIDLDLSSAFNRYLKPPELRDDERPTHDPEHSMVWGLHIVLWQLSQIVPNDQHPEKRFREEPEFKQSTNPIFKGRILQGLQRDPEQRPTLAEAAEYWQKEQENYSKNNLPY